MNKESIYQLLKLSQSAPVMYDLVTIMCCVDYAEDILRPPPTTFLSFLGKQTWQIND